MRHGSGWRDKPRAPGRAALRIATAEARRATLATWGLLLL